MQNDAILTASGQIISLNTRNQASAFIQVSGTWVGTIQFEATVDGTNWFSIQGFDNLGNPAITNSTVNGQWRFNVAGIQEIRVRVSAYTSGSINVSLQSTPSGFVLPIPIPVLPEGQKATYSVGVVGLAGASGDVLAIIGSATKTIRISRVQVSGVATAATDIDIALIKRSAADTGGTATTPAIVPHDSNDAAATAVVSAYTVAPTPGAAVGTIEARKLTVPSITSPAIPSLPQVFDFELRGEKAIVLRGVAQSLAVNIPSVPAGGAFNIDITFTEE